MDLAIIQKECDSVFTNRWIDVGASRLCLNYALYVCEELKLSKKIKSSMSTDDLAFLLSTKVLVNWVELKDINGNDVPFTQLAAFNAMANDLNFLNIVTDLSFDRNRFG